jgi:probable HAF family extracellular repeat protein
MISRQKKKIWIPLVAVGVTYAESGGAPKGRYPMRLCARGNFCRFLVFAIFMFTITPASMGQAYHMKILSRTAGETSINSSGEIVGVSRTRRYSLAFLWTKAIGMQILGGISGASFATGINNSEQVVGWFGDPGTPEAFIWTKATGMQDLGFSGIPSGINDLGQIVGDSYASNYHAFLWTQASGFQDLGTLGGCCSQAFSINNSGQVGWSYTPSDDLHPFLWTQATGMQDLGFRGEALGINNVGQVVGYYYNGQTDRAYLWSETTRLQDLGTDEGYGSVAFAINDKGQVMGDADYFFLWSESAGLQNLSALTSGQVLVMGSSGTAEINNAGQIATNAELLTGNSAAVVFTPNISVSLTSSPNPSHVGQEFTVTATATSISGSPPDGESIEF